MSDKIKKSILAIFLFLVWSLIVLLILRGSVFRYGVDFEELVIFIILSVVTYLVFLLLPAFLVRFLRLKSLYNKQKQRKIRQGIDIILIVALISSVVIVLLGLFALGWLDYCSDTSDCVSSSVCYYKVVFNPFSYYGLLSHQCVPFIFKYSIVFKISIYLFMVSVLFLYIGYPALLFYYMILKIKSYRRLKNKKRMGLSIFFLILIILWLLPVLFSSIISLNALYCSNKNSYKCEQSFFCTYLYNRCYPFYLKLIE